MNEFIKKLIERLEELKKREMDREENITEDGYWEDCEEAFEDGESNGMYTAYTRAIQIVNQLAEEHSDGWIPCEKELPPQPKENPLYEGKALEIYLVCTSDGDLPFRAFWNGEFFTQGFAREDVIAWQPLPAPYQPKGE